MDDDEITGGFAAGWGIAEDDAAKTVEDSLAEKLNANDILREYIKLVKAHQRLEMRNARLHEAILKGQNQQRVLKGVIAACIILGTAGSAAPTREFVLGLVKTFY